MTDQAHSTRAHARLAPSAAKRWMNCAGSVRLSEGIPDITSSFAAEGTAAHEVCSKCLQEGKQPSDFAGMWVDIKTGAIVDTPEDTDEADRFFEVDDEMVDGVAMYVDLVHTLSLFDGTAEANTHLVEVEQRLDMTHLHREIFGTGDATVFDTYNRHLHVVDFKYGKGVAVDADENPQLLLYAAGAARRHHNMQIEKLTMWIVQPRAPHVRGPVRSYEIDLLDLFEFEDTVAAAALATEAPDAPTAAGDWCRFCKALPVCPTARTAALAAAGDEFGAVDTESLPAPENMDPAHRGRVMREADRIGTWVKAIQEFEHAQAMAGNMPDGFKLVAKRANRKWRAEADAELALMKLGFGQDHTHTEPKLKSPAQLEKFFPGKNAAQRQAAMADLVVKQSSGTNLVPVNDPRPAVFVGATADFEVVETA